MFYVDFILFHKLLYIDEMICVEREPIPRRMRFNKPYPFVRLRMGEFSEFIPELDRRRPHLAWIDYDTGPRPETLDDVVGLARVLMPSSVVIVTFEALPRVPPEEDDPRARITPLRYYRDTLGPLLGGRLRAADVTPGRLPTVIARALRQLLRETLAERGLTFAQLFNFVYADGAQMLTLGGMICDRTCRQMLRNSVAMRLPFVGNHVAPRGISVPPLTERERQWLEKNGGKRVAFELEPSLLARYLSYRRYYPAYFEAVV